MGYLLIKIFRSCTAHERSGYEAWACVAPEAGLCFI